MNVRQKKKFHKKCGLKRYDTLGKLKSSGRARLLIDNKWCTATIAVTSDCVNKNRRCYSSYAMHESIIKSIQNNENDISDKMRHCMDNSHPTFSCRAVIGEIH